MFNSFINSISSNLLHSNDEAVAFRLVSANGKVFLLPFCIQHKAHPNWAEPCQLLFRLCSRRLFLRPCCLDGTTAGALSCYNEPLFFVDKKLIKQLRPHTPHLLSLSALQDFLRFLLILALLSNHE